MTNSQNKIFWRFAIYLTLVVLTTNACRKEYNDQVIFYDLIPDVEFSTVQYYTPSVVPMGCPDVPTPRDSSIRYLIDLDMDSQADFEIHAHHSPVDVYCGHCARHTYSISIKGLNVGDSIKVDSDNPYIPAVIMETDTLTLDSHWGEWVQLRLMEGCVLPFHTDFNHQYIGVKKGYMLGLIQVASLNNNGIKILDFAVNLTEGNPIIAGEK